MCVSERVSWGLYVLMTGIAGFVWHHSRAPHIRWQCAFVVVFSMVQLVECGLWISIHHHVWGLNSFLTRLLLPLLWCQPLVNCAGALFWRASRAKPLLAAYCTVLVAALGHSVVTAFSSEVEFESRVSELSHLIWRRSDLPARRFMGDTALALVHYGGMALPLLVMRPLADGLVLLLVGLAVLLLSASNYYSDGSFSSMWCLFSPFYLATVCVLNLRGRK